MGLKFSWERNKSPAWPHTAAHPRLLFCHLAVLCPGRQGSPGQVHMALYVGTLFEERNSISRTFMHRWVGSFKLIYILFQVKKYLYSLNSNPQSLINQGFMVNLFRHYKKTVLEQMAPKYYFLVLFEWVTWGSEYHELHLEACVQVYILIMCGVEPGEWVSLQKVCFLHRNLKTG